MSEFTQIISFQVILFALEVQNRGPESDRKFNPSFVHFWQYPTNWYEKNL